MARLLLSTSVTSHSSHTLLASTMSWGQTNLRVADSQGYLLCAGRRKNRAGGLILQRTPHFPPQWGQSRPPCTQPHPLTTHLTCYQLEIHSVIFKFSFFPNIFFRNPNNSGKPSDWSPFSPPRTFTVFSAGLKIVGEIVSWAHCFYYFKIF